MYAQKVLAELETARETLKVAGQILAEEVAKGTRKRPQSERALRFLEAYYKYLWEEAVIE